MHSLLWADLNLHLCVYVACEGILVLPSSIINQLCYYECVYQIK